MTTLIGTSDWLRAVGLQNQKLLAENARLVAENARLRREVAALKARIDSARQ